MLTDVALTQQEFNEWLCDVCLDWAIQRVFWVPSYSTSRPGSGPPVGRSSSGGAEQGAPAAAEGAFSMQGKGFTSAAMPASVAQLQGRDTLLAAVREACVGSSDAAGGGGDAAMASSSSGPAGGAWAGGARVTGVRLQVWPKAQEAGVAVS